MNIVLHPKQAMLNPKLVIPTYFTADNDYNSSSVVLFWGHIK